MTDFRALTDKYKSKGLSARDAKRQAIIDLGAASKDVTPPSIEAVEDETEGAEKVPSRAKKKARRGKKVP